MKAFVPPIAWPLQTVDAKGQGSGVLSRVKIDRRFEQPWGGQSCPMSLSFLCQDNIYRANSLITEAVTDTSVEVSPRESDVSSC